MILVKAQSPSVGDWCVTVCYMIERSSQVKLCTLSAMNTGITSGFEVNEIIFHKYIFYEIKIRVTGVRAREANPAGVSGSAVSPPRKFCGFASLKGLSMHILSPSGGLS